MADEPVDGVLHVGSGTFRVDRRRALEVLSRFQVPEPWMYLLPLVRCAVASGASRVSITPSAGAVAIAFDGRRFSRDSLGDPYACLFDEERPDGRRHRELAMGLLAALRLASRVSVASGGARLSAEGLGGERVEDAPHASAGETVVRVESGNGALWGPERPGQLERWCAASRIPVRAGGVELAREKPGDPRNMTFDEDGVRGWVTVPALALDASALDACSLGVLAAKVRPSLSGVQVEGRFDSDDLRLDASQSGVVEDEAYARALGVIERQAQRLLLDVAGRQGSLLARAGKAMLRPAGRARWRARLEGREPAAPGGFLSSLFGVRRRGADSDTELDWCARTTAWLRRACLKPKPADAVWKAPILLGTCGVPLSLFDVAAMHERLGYVPVAREPGGFREGVWLASSRDVEVLTRHFPDSLRMAELGGPPAPAA